MKFSWPIGIVLFYGIFVVLLVSFVIFTTFNKVDLVSDDYYAQELNYQQHIDRVERTKSLDQGLFINYDMKEKKIEVQFPTSIPAENITGKIVFFRPSDAILDHNTSIQVGPGGRQTLDISNLNKGMWRIKIFWQVLQQEYFNEKSILVN